jgi:hypothetical protein
MQDREDSGKAHRTPVAVRPQAAHFAADDLLDRGVSVQSVAQMLGHEKVETTMLYRTKRLSRLYADKEVRAVDRARFRSSGPTGSPAAPRPDVRAVNVPEIAAGDAAASDVRGGFKSRRTSRLDEWTGRDLNPSPPVCKTGDLPD